MELDPKTRVIHARRQSGYTFLGRATFQAETDIHKDYDVHAVYLSDDGLLCTRPEGEFKDGRFDTDAAGPQPNAMEAAVESIRKVAELLTEEGRGDYRQILDMLDSAAKIAKQTIVLNSNAMLAGATAFATVEAAHAGKKH